MSNAVAKALKKAVRLAGGQTALAEKVNERVKGTGVKPITQAHVWNWLFRDKRVPGEYGIPIEDVIHGEVTRHELCPTVFGDGRSSQNAEARA
jgi:DNA-binding transcriptional regulator YdaS (Cro superfamily)